MSFLSSIDGPVKPIGKHSRYVKSTWKTAGVELGYYSRSMCSVAFAVNVVPVLADARFIEKSSA